MVINKINGITNNHKTSSDFFAIPEAGSTSQNSSTQHATQSSGFLFDRLSNENNVTPLKPVTQSPSNTSNNNTSSTAAPFAIVTQPSSNTSNNNTSSNATPFGAVTQPSSNTSNNNTSSPSTAIPFAQRLPIKKTSNTATDDSSNPSNNDNSSDTATLVVGSEFGLVNNTNLDWHQGYNDLGYTSDCGLASSTNLLIEAGLISPDTYNGGTGYDTAESTVVDYAATHGYCDTSEPNVADNGGVYNDQTVALLGHFGLGTQEKTLSIDDVANDVSQGKGVILNVDAYKLWNINPPTTDGTPDVGYHDITVTGVVYSGSKVEGFYICDSGDNQGSQQSEEFIPYDKLKSCMVSVGDSNGSGDSNAVVTNSRLNLIACGLVSGWS